MSVQKFQDKASPSWKVPKLDLTNLCEISKERDQNHVLQQSQKTLRSTYLNGQSNLLPVRGGGGSLPRGPQAALATDRVVDHQLLNEPLKEHIECK